MRQRRKFISIARRLRANGYTFGDIAHVMNERGFRTPKGEIIYPQYVRGAINDTAFTAAKTRAERLYGILKIIHRYRVGYAKKPWKEVADIVNQHGFRTIQGNLFRTSSLLYIWRQHVNETGKRES